MPTPSGSGVTQALRGVPPELSAIQALVRGLLDQVGDEIQRIFCGIAPCDGYDCLNVAFRSD